MILPPKMSERVTLRAPYGRAGLTDAGRVSLAAGKGAVEIYAFISQRERRPAR